MELFISKAQAGCRVPEEIIQKPGKNNIKALFYECARQACTGS